MESALCSPEPTHRLLERQEIFLSRFPEILSLNIGRTEDSVPSKQAGVVTYRVPRSLDDSSVSAILPLYNALTTVAGSLLLCARPRLRSWNRWQNNRNDVCRMLQEAQVRRVHRCLEPGGSNLSIERHVGIKRHGLL